MSAGNERGFIDFLQSKEKGGSPMKCPLLAHKTYIVDDYPMQVYEECLTEECAWWDTAYELCVIRSVARLLDGVLADLNQIRDKMPHEEQSRR